MVERATAIDWGCGRGARVRLAAARGHAGPPERPGHRPRHVQPPPRGPARRRDRRALRPARPPPRRARRRFDDPRQPALARPRVLGFEFGFCAGRPARRSCIWEAQFGDFVNGAQVIIDQFIARARVEVAAHERPGAAPAARLRGPGAGALERAPRALPRSSAPRTTSRSCNLTTPAQYFHVLRRQMQRTFRKPLVVMTPKSLLRHKRAVSPLDELHRRRASSNVLDDRDARRSATRVRRRAARAAARSTTTCSRQRERAQTRRRRDRPRRAALSVPARRARGVARALPERARGASGCRRSRRTWARWRFMRTALAARRAGEARRSSYVGRDAGREPGDRLATRCTSSRSELLEQAFARCERARPRR